MSRFTLVISALVVLPFSFFFNVSIGGAADKGLVNPDDVLDLEKMKPRGKWYDATVPDTLDLAERARVLRQRVDPEYRTERVLQRLPIIESQAGREGW